MIAGIFIFLASVIYSFRLGDGKQGPVEPYWALVIAVFTLCVSIWVAYKNTNRQTDRLTTILVGSVFVSLFLTTWTSISLAYSLSTVVRFTAAACMFFCLYTIPKKHTTVTAMATGIIYIIVVVSVVSLFDRFSGTNTMWLPVMNLIFSRTGHNQAAYFLIAFFPLIFRWTRDRITGIRSVIGYILLPLAIIFCFSRGALLMLGLYLTLTIFTDHGKQRQWSGTLLLIVSIICLGIMTIIPWLPSDIQTTLGALPFANNQLVKTTLTHEARLSNWREAVIGFTHHPLLGTGPGTFMLTAMRYHRNLIDASGSAHSFFLQTLSEFGIIGSIPIFLLVAVVCNRMWSMRKRTDRNHWAIIGLNESVLLMFAYSAIEYNLDYFSLWILLWGIVGLLMSSDDMIKTRIPLKLVVPTALFLLLFASSYYCGIRLQKNMDTYAIGYYLRSYDVDRTERFIDYKNSIRQRLSPFEMRLITVLHKNQPDVAVTLANAADIMSPEERDVWYHRAMDGNRLNSYYRASYMKFLYTQHRMDEFAAQYTAFIDVAYALTHVPPPANVSLRDASWIPLYERPDFLTLFDGPASWTETASKTLYFLGLWTLPDNAQTTRKLWNMALTLSPDWSPFYHELAGLEKNVFGHVIPMQVIFARCQMRPALTKACPKNAITFEHIGAPGFHEEEIRRMPLP